MSYKPYQEWKSLPTYPFIEEEIKRAQNIRAKEDKIPGEQYEDYSPYRFAGKLGEWAFGDFMGYEVPDDFMADKFDFRHHFTQEKIEVKTVTGNRWLFADELLVIRTEQWLRKPSDITVICYYERPKAHLIIVGWDGTQALKYQGETFEKNDPIPDRKGNTRFLCSSPGIGWYPKDLKHPNELKHKINLS